MPWRWRVVWGHWKVLNFGLDNLLATLIFWDPKRNHFQINNWPTAKGSFVAILEGIWPQKHREPRNQKATSDVHGRDRHGSLPRRFGDGNWPRKPHPFTDHLSANFHLPGKGRSYDDKFIGKLRPVTLWQIPNFSCFPFGMNQQKYIIASPTEGWKWNLRKNSSYHPSEIKDFKHGSTFVRHHHSPWKTADSQGLVYDRSIKGRKPYRNVYPKLIRPVRGLVQLLHHQCPLTSDLVKPGSRLKEPNYLI